MFDARSVRRDMRSRLRRAPQRVIVSTDDFFDETPHLHQVPAVASQSTIKQARLCNYLFRAKFTFAYGTLDVIPHVSGGRKSTELDAVYMLWAPSGVRKIRAKCRSDRVKCAR